MASEVSNVNVPRQVWAGYDTPDNTNLKRVSNDQEFRLWYTRPETIPKLRDISIQAAKDIRANTDKEIVVLYSGGMDSEWVMESFVAAKVEVTPLLVEYADGLNSHDMMWARRYLSRRGIKNAMIERLDLRAWTGSKAQYEIAEMVQTPELAFTAQFQTLAKYNNGNRFFVTGYDEPGLIADDKGSEREWFLYYNERHFSVVKLFESLEIPGISNWTRSSAAMFASYVCQPQWQLLASNMYSPTVWNTEMIKIPMFHSWFPFMEARTKYTGFEKALDFIVEGSRAWQEIVKERHGGATWNQEWRTNIRDVWDTLEIGRTR